MIFLKKNKKNNNQIANDLTSFVSPEEVMADPNGSYTGVTYDTYFNGELEEPIQDADDL